LLVVFWETHLQKLCTAFYHEMLERQEVSNFTQHNIQPYITQFAPGSAFGHGEVREDKCRKLVVSLYLAENSCRPETW